MEGKFRLFGLQRVFHATALGLFGLLFATVAHGSTPPADPILRIDPQMHTAPIRSIAVDSRGRYLVTGSEDKTVRVWDATTGDLLKILRPPVGSENEGRIYAVAISPDGSTVACGGRTAKDWDDSYSIYFFNRETGQLEMRIEGEASLILNMSYSPDGRYLAVGLHEGKGLVVYDMEAGRRLAADEDYDSPCYSVHFDRSGRLVTASLSGDIRIYDVAFNLLVKRKAPGGKVPLTAIFSPDGSQVAVGFADSTSVDILSGTTLERIRQADLKGVDRGNLGSVAWSPDGSLLYGAGQWENKEGVNLVRIWKDGGRVFHKDVAASRQDTIHEVIGLPGGGVAFASGDPSFGVFDQNGHLAFFKSSPVVDFRDGHNELLISKDGKSVQFRCLRDSGVAKMSFSITKRQLTQPAPTPSDASLKAPRTQAANLQVKDWQNGGAPSIGGKKIALDARERSWSLAIAPDGQSFVLGSDWTLRRIDRRGKELWKVQTPGVTRAVNISGDGRAVVATHGDGTLRWYRLDDGVELLALFLHADNLRWVLWTLSGYYDASPGGEELIGWHVNRGAAVTPDFFPAGTFRERFYRPDIVQEILVEQDESRAVAVSNQHRPQVVETPVVARMLPPAARILSPASGAELDASRVMVKVEFRTAADAPLTNVEVRVNGRPQPGAHEPGTVTEEAGTLQTQQIPVDLSSIHDKEAIITIQGVNRHGYGPPADVNVRLAAKTGASQKLAAAPKLYLLSIGISAYQDESLSLMYAAKDAEDVVTFFRNQEGGLYREVEVRLITDQDATLQAIRDGLFWLEEQVTANDMAMIFIAGHGINDNAGQLHFASHELDVKALRRTGLPATDIVKTISYLQGRVVYYMDTCHSGNLDFVRRSVGGVDLNRHIQDLSAAETGAVVFSSAAGSQYALESTQWGNGAFTMAMVDGLGGKADYNRDGAVSVNELNLFISEQVKQLTNNQQNPVMQKPNSIRDFPLAVLLNQ